MILRDYTDKTPDYTNDDNRSNPDACPQRSSQSWGPPTPFSCCQEGPSIEGAPWPPCPLHSFWLSQPLGYLGITGQHCCPSKILVLLGGCLHPRLSLQVTCETVTVTGENDSGWFILWECWGQASPRGSPIS